MERTGKLVMTNKIQQNVDKVKETWVKIKSFFTEVVAETKKVTWPSIKEVRDTTIVVIIAVFIFGFFLYLVDLGLHGILKILFRKA
jgi:preprotein translocase subunit SecE